MDFGRGTIIGSQQQQQVDSRIVRFYEKLGEIFSTWIPLEDVYYRLTEFAETIELNKCEEVNSSKWPDLDFFHVAVSKNGGPVAMMIQDNVLFIGMKEIKSMIFIFSSFGKKLAVINVSQISMRSLQLAKKLETAKEKLKWASLSFTPDEDLCLLSSDGTLFLIDPLTGEDKEKPTSLGPEFLKTSVVDGKLFDSTLVFRNTQN